MKKISLIVLLMMMSIGTMWSQNVNELLSDLKKEIAPDGRTAIWDVNTATQNGVVTLYGKVELVKYFIRDLQKCRSFFFVN